MLKGMRAYGVVDADGKQTAVKRGPDNGRKSVVTSSLSSGAPGGGASTGGQISGVTSFRGNYELGVMDGTIDLRNRKLLIALCRDMYMFDTIAGSAIDLMSNLPFSDFTLSGINDKKILQTYARSCENLRLRKFFPSMSIEYLTDGAHQSTLDWDQSEGIFKSIISHDSLDIDVVELPTFGSDPLLTLRVSERMKKLAKLAEKDPRIKKAVDGLPSIFKSMMSGKVQGGGSGKNDEILLQPSSTVYIARQTYSWKSEGTSYLHRIIPIWLMEKAFIRGTTESIYQRQRPIIHITAGDGGEYEPDDAELATIAELIKGASMDPVGAVIATRPDININEVVRGEDFWKWMDVNDQFAAAKLKALGISDAFLSGDSNFSTLEVSLSTFMEQLKAFRAMTTREFFNEKMFPSIAVAMDFKKSKRDMRVTSERELASPYTETSMRGNLIQTRKRGGREEFIAICDGSSVADISQIKDITEYYIPTVDWHKQLGPTADTNYMDVLQQLTERGVPVPLRTIAAAGGMDIDKLMSQMDDDMELRTDLSKHMKKIKKLLGEDDGGGFSDMSSFGNSARVRKARQRDYRETGATEQYRVREVDSRGKTRYATPKYQRQLEERMNRETAKALQRIADGSVRPPSAKRVAKNSPFGRMR